MRKKDTKKMTPSELNKKVEQLKKDLFNLRFQKSNGQLMNPSKFRIVRRNISRILTQIRQQNKI